MAGKGIKNKLKDINKNMKKILKELDQLDLNELKNKFAEIKAQDSGKVKIFTVKYITGNNKFDFINSEVTGLYLIEARFKENSEDSWEDFIALWKSFDAKTPNIIKKRKENFFKSLSSDFNPLYIGKSEDINKRLNEHFFCKTKDKKSYLKSTSALRLKQFFEEHNTSDKVSKMEFRVSYLDLDFHDTLLYELEKKLRSDLNCMIGKN